MGEHSEEEEVPLCCHTDHGLEQERTQGEEQRSYDVITRTIAEELNAVVVSVDYRLYPAVHFPKQYEDCLSAAKYFLSPEVLSQYSVDPLRVAVSGDSAGGNLAAALAQEISTDDRVSVKFSVQALVYPALQALDFHTPSYQQNQGMPILYRTLMARFWLQYLGAEVSLMPLLLANNHSSLAQAALTPELRARLDWTTLLPPRHKKHYRLVTAATGGLVKDIPALVDVRASPLLADSGVLSQCPRAYILTSEFDVLRDDGLMYAQRLQEAGVTVTNDHYGDGFHGCFSFGLGPMYFDVGRRSMAGYLHWLQENL
ncbi:neutral cholesterol ester hydrolase 1a [Aplochiton taeniatus]